MFDQKVLDLLLSVLIFSYSYHIGVINAPSDYIKQWINETVQANYNVDLSESGLDLFWSFVVSIFLVGGAVGSLGGSVVADRIGRYLILIKFCNIYKLVLFRKGSYLACVILFVIGSLSFQFCRELSSIALLIFGRLLVGLASGI